MAGSEYLTQDDDIDVAGAFAALRRRWWLVVLVTLIAGAGLFFVLSSLDPKYQSDARILIKDNNAFTRATSDNNIQGLGNQLDQKAIRSEVEIVSSNKLALQVIDELNLTEVEEFNDASGSPGFMDLLSAMLGQAPTSTGDIRNEVLDEFKDRLQVYAVEQSRVVVIEFWAHDSALAQEIVAALSNNYIRFKNTERASSQETATSWLDPRIKELETAVSEKEAAVAEFRASEDLLRSTDNESLLATQQLSQISTELSRLKAQRSSAQAKVAAVRNAIQSGSSLEVIPEVVESNLVQRLNERRATLQAQVSDLSVTLLPNHPRMKSLQSQLSNLQQQIRRAAQNIVVSLQGDVDSIREAEADLAREIVRLKAEASRVDEKLVGLRARQREAETARDLLAEYKSRSLEAKSRAGLSQTDAEIISAASLATEAYFPKVVPFTMAGTVAAMLLTALAIIAGNLLTVASSGMRSNVREQRTEPGMNADQSQGESGGQQTGIFANEEHEAEGDATAATTMNKQEEKNEAALAVRYVATALSEMKNVRLSVISPAGKPGSRTSYLLARQLAAKNRSTVVIELSEEGAVANEMLGWADFPGFFNLVTGAVTADRAIFKDVHSSAHVVPAGALFPGQAAPDAEEISDMVDAIAEAYDCCIVDCGAADISELNIVSDDDTVAIISCVNVDGKECQELEDRLKDDGFDEVLQVLPDNQDIISEERVAA